MLFVAKKRYTFADHPLIIRVCNVGRLECKGVISRFSLTHGTFDYKICYIILCLYIFDFLPLPPPPSLLLLSQRWTP